MNFILRENKKLIEMGKKKVEKKIGDWLIELRIGEILGIEWKKIVERKEVEILSDGEDIEKGIEVIGKKSWNIEKRVEMNESLRIRGCVEDEDLKRNEWIMRGNKKIRDVRRGGRIENMCNVCNRIWRLEWR